MSAVETRLSDRRELLASVDLGALLEDLAGLPARGWQYPCPNPAHEQTGSTPPVSVAAGPDGYELGKCFACGWAGTVVENVEPERRAAA